MIPQGGCWINLPIELQKEYLGNSYNSGGGKRDWQGLDTLSSKSTRRGYENVLKRFSEKTKNSCFMLL